MTPKEAIKILEIAKAEVEWNYPLDYAIAIDTAIEALEKQIPKKPTDVCEPVVRWGICPVCKGELNKLGGRPNRIFQSQKYCSDCGQAIDWGDEE